MNTKKVIQIKIMRAKQTKYTQTNKGIVCDMVEEDCNLASVPLWVGYDSVSES